MRRMVLLSCLIVVGLWSPAVKSDIYIWEDRDGVKHISNVSPPPQAEVFLRTPPRDAAGEEKGDAENRLAVERAKVETRQREERLAAQQAVLERRIVAAEEDLEAARSALEEAEDRLEAAERRHERQSRDVGTLVYGTRFWVAPRYDRFTRHEYKHPHFKRDRFRKQHRSDGIVFEGRPFHLGTIHIPLFNAHDHFRRPNRHVGDDSKFEHRRHSPSPHGHPRNDGRRKDRVGNRQ